MYYAGRFNHAKLIRWGFQTPLKSDEITQRTVRTRIVRVPLQGVGSPGEPVAAVASDNGPPGRISLLLAGLRHHTTRANC